MSGVDLDKLTLYLKANLESLRGMESQDANHITCVYFLVTTALLIGMPIQTEFLKKYVVS